MTSSIQEVRARHRGRLLALPGVVSVGIGLDAEGHPAIVLGLCSDPTEGSSELPASLDGHPVVTRVVGELRLR